GTELPLKTNVELIQVLQLLNDKNDVTARRNENLYRHAMKKTKPPGNITIYKGEFHVTLSRKFVEYCYKSKLANDFYYWLNGTAVPDEHYYPTLNRLPQFPGHASIHYEGTRFMSRFKIWRLKGLKAQNQRSDLCRSDIFIRAICQFDWHDLPTLTKSNYLFANKFNQKLDMLGISCLEQWHQAKSMTSVKIDLNDFNKFPPIKKEI
ncbi:unnamed protein product, partial [Didymodactylos carnosus]